MTLLRTLLSALLANGLTLLGIAAAHAQAYPNKPITIVTAFGPGSASDTITRVVAQPLGVALKQNVSSRPVPAPTAPSRRCMSRVSPCRRLHAVDDDELAALRRTVPDEEHRL